MKNQFHPLRFSNYLRRTVTTAVVALHVAMFLQPASPAEAQSGQIQLQKAQESILFGEFDEALAMVESAIASGELEGGSLREAHVLAAQCHLEAGDDDALKQSICSAHIADPLWRPSTAILTEAEVTRFSEALRLCPKNSPKVSFPETIPVQTPSTEGEEDGDSGKPWFKRPLGWIVGGAAAAAGVAVVILGGGGGDDAADPEDPVGMGDFPDPPTQ